MGSGTLCLLQASTSFVAVSRDKRCPTETKMGRDVPALQTDIPRTSPVSTPTIGKQRSSRPADSINDENG